VPGCWSHGDIGGTDGTVGGQLRAHSQSRGRPVRGRQDARAKVCHRRSLPDWRLHDHRQRAVSGSDATSTHALTHTGTSPQFSGTVNATQRPAGHEGTGRTGRADQPSGRAKSVPDAAAANGVQRGTTGTPIVTARRKPGLSLQVRGSSRSGGGSRIRTLEGTLPSCRHPRAASKPPSHFFSCAERVAPRPLCDSDDLAAAWRGCLRDHRGEAVRRRVLVVSPNTTSIASTVDA
jgi:hypothetical protein